ncbi:unannotated protein [freshwater metagenome]|uniref:Unannotated protein n=1 Tax=freshwater metagenome TaxID=449393 RepID=A0A6J6C6I5_9ZZZZ
MLLSFSVGSARPAGAESQGSASSRLVGRGDIVTSILFQIGSSSRPRRNSGSAPAPRCRWITFTDAQIEFLIAIMAPNRSDPRVQPLLDSLQGFLGTSELGNLNLQGQVCDGQTVAFRATPRSSSLDLQTQINRQMITRLPPPAPVQSPPVGVVVPVREPVFVSIPDEGWQPVEATLSLNGITVDVRAAPISLRIFSGEPTAQMQTCNGQGVRYEPFSPLLPAQQAATNSSCVLRYERATQRSIALQEAAPDPTVPSSWLGTVTVVWLAYWRVGGGPWRGLGAIPRTRLIERATREVRTAIESGG